MVRTNAAAVKLIMRDGQEGSDYDGSTDLTSFIETAAAIVDDIVEEADDAELTIPSTRLELIERWLAAWAYCLSDKPEQSTSTDGTSSTFEGQSGKGFEANKYGQMAMQLDPTGFLAGTPSADLDWGGKPFSEQIPYESRD